MRKEMTMLKQRQARGEGTQRKKTLVGKVFHVCIIFPLSFYTDYLASFIVHKNIIFVDLLRSSQICVFRQCVKDTLME